MTAGVVVVPAGVVAAGQAGQQVAYAQLFHAGCCVWPGRCLHSIAAMGLKDSQKPVAVPQVTHVTERTGRPYALVLTKTKRHWEERQAEGRHLAGLAQELQALLPAAAPWEGAAAAAAALAGVPRAAAAAGRQQQQQQQRAARTDHDVIDLT